MIDVSSASFGSHVEHGPSHSGNSRSFFNLCIFLSSVSLYFLEVFGLYKAEVLVQVQLVRRLYKDVGRGEVGLRGEGLYPFKPSNWTNTCRFLWGRDFSCSFATGCRFLFTSRNPCTRINWSVWWKPALMLSFQSGSVNSVLPPSCSEEEVPELLVPTSSEFITLYL